MEARTKMKLPKRIPPPTSIKRELVRIWEGWNFLGNREIIREAAVKGIYINEVIKFLSLRQQSSENDTRDLFKKEVSLYVDDLLNHKQIFRACHILDNIGENSSRELSRKMYTTCDKGLRESIATHLSKSGHIDSNTKMLSDFLHLITKHVNILSSKFLLDFDSMSLEILEQQGSEWKWELAAILFLKTYDERLMAFLNRDAFWRHLLRIDEIEILITWIHMMYDNEDCTRSTKIHKNLKAIIIQFPITDHMLNSVDSQHCKMSTKDVILNEFSKFGVFCDNEKTDIVKMLKRLFDARCIQYVFSIISSRTSVISLGDFLTLLVDFCLNRELYSVMSSCLGDTLVPDLVLQKYNSNKHFDLVCDFKYLFSNFTEWAIRNNIVKVCRYLSTNGDFYGYLKDNSDAAVALLTFSKDISFLDVISRNKAILIDNVNINDIYDLVLRKYPLLNSVYKHTIEPSNDEVFSLYDLLDSSHVIKTKELFKFRFDETATLPHFDDEQLTEECGYNKDVDYVVYLKHNRPAVAAIAFTDQQIVKHKTINKLKLEKAIEKATRYVLTNLNDAEICASSVIFLEMLGHKTKKIRNFISVSKVLQELGYRQENFETIFKQSGHELEPIKNQLEEVIMLDVDFDVMMRDGSELIKYIKNFHLLVQFCKHYDLRLPETFLKCCARRNLWFPFLLFSQLHNYPLNQVAKLVHNFKNPNTIEHIEHAITHNIPVYGNSSSMRQRSRYLSKVGVRRQPQPQETQEEIISKIFSKPRTISSSSDVGERIVILYPRATLLQILIKCHDSSDPPRALLQACEFYKYPQLAIFATCYEPDSYITCWLTWLAVSCDLKSFINSESVAFDPNSVSELLNACIEHKYPKTLLESFAIFLPDNPLRNLISIIVSCVNHDLDLDSLSCKLAAFSDGLKKLRSHSNLPEADKDMSYLMNRMWIETTAIQLLGTAFNSNLKSLYDQIIVLKAISDLDWDTLVLCAPPPNFKNVLALLKILFDSKSYARTVGTKYSGPVILDFCNLFNEKCHSEEVANCINTLLDKNLFEAALKVSQFEDIPIDLVITRQWQHKFMLAEGHDKTFWTECDDSFIKHKIKPESVIDFYQARIQDLNDSLQAYRLQKLIIKWADEFQLPNRYELEAMLWLTYINLKSEAKKEETFPVKSKVFCYGKLTEDLENIPIYNREIHYTPRKQIEELISEILDAGNFWLALKIEKMFSCRNIDLEMLKLCFSLAEGIIKPYQLNTEQRSLLTRKSTFKKSRRLWNVMPLNSSTASATQSSSRAAVDLIDAPVQDVLGILQTLTEKLSSGIGIGENIFMLYRISINIEQPYKHVISESDPLKMLRKALVMDCLNKLEVVHDVVTVYEWSNDKVSDFMCEAIVTAAGRHVTSKVYTCSMWDLDLDKNFECMLRLLQDNTSILGYQLFAYVQSVFSANVASELKFKSNDLINTAEILIRAHDCFTLDCNTEGITLVLRLCHEVVFKLLELRNWKTMVRLLTGVGRYTEMKYVFHILKEQDQFEYLLRKNLKNNVAFKFALLDFLKKRCAKNYDLLKMVALHFALYPEVAQLWETEAETSVNNSISIAKMEMQNNQLDINNEPLLLLTKTIGTRNLLRKAMQCYEHASEFYMSGEKLKKSISIVRQAELIALQLSLLENVLDNETAICVLKLTPTQIDLVIKKHLGFFQSKIVVETYSYQPIWEEILYDRYVKGHHEDYLKHFLTCFQLTDSMVNNLTAMYLYSDLVNEDATKAMKDIVSNIRSVHIKYKVASELGFKEIVESLLDGDELCYLKDTVWKRGYGQES